MGYVGSKLPTKVIPIILYMHGGWVYPFYSGAVRSGSSYYLSITGKGMERQRIGIPSLCAHPFLFWETWQTKEKYPKGISILPSGGSVPPIL